MKLPKNKDGNYYLVNENGKEVVFGHAVDVLEALFGVYGKDDKDENFKSEYFLPDGFDMKINSKKSLTPTKEDLMEKQIKKGKPGRPPKVKEPEDPEKDKESNKESNDPNKSEE